ncbi:MAG TPA: response regulator transcription factor [Candidatus Dormibacteraeota bacterium]|nr:response regulator transcription factor [Candidatus Dormibacteraeota bacterium]
MSTGKGCLGQNLFAMLPLRRHPKTVAAIPRCATHTLYKKLSVCCLGLPCFGFNEQHGCVTNTQYTRISDKEALSLLTEEMAKPRMAKSVRAEMSRQAEEDKRTLVSTVKATILLVDDHKRLRQELRLHIEAQAGWQVCCEAKNGNEAVEKFNEFLPDLTIMDFQMPEMNGLDASRKIIQHHPDAAILMLSVHETPDIIQEARNIGIKGYCPKSEIACILDAATALLAGKTFFNKPSTKTSFSLIDK